MPKKLLLADDDNDLCELIKLKLEDCDCEVTVVNNGLEVLNLVRKGYRPNALVLDLMMPERSGIELLDSIKSAWPQTYIIIYTGRLDFVAGALKEYVDKVLFKSANVDELVKAIKSFI
ncbi:MAG: response regulator [Candidatus Omnitrophica bacterium]|nr:response regulator [Candidatus Omnitrophota bacterium]